MSHFETHSALPSVSRRKFLQAAGVTGLANCLDRLAPGFITAESLAAGAIHRMDLPDTGWRIWPDTEAQWRDDKIFLPAEVDIAQLPINPPIPGWEALSSDKGVLATLPASVEQFYWGKFGLRPYAGDEYKYEPSSPEAIKNGTADSGVKNGAYYGVSWWWKEVEIPVGYKGKRIFLHIRGARQRAEVYLNRKLVGYSILEELPFECDLTPAALPGQKNHLAIRITNPGGRLDWVDRSSLYWGGVCIQKSHGFGAIDRGMVLTAHDLARIADTWVLNTPEPQGIKAFADIENSGGEAISGTLRFTVRDPANDHTIGEKQVPTILEPGKAACISVDIHCPDARLWDIETPALYRLIVRFESANAVDVRERDFGFRWFAPEGLGKDAVFRLNGRRIRLYSAISWGYWPLNGLFPTPEFSVKEVMAAKRLNLNCLNFHRNPGKEDVLDIQDRMGLLRFMEPGGGAFAADVIPEDVSKPTGSNGTSAPKMSLEARRFQKRYEQAKILRMIRTFRSHPSLVGWTLQNEGRTDLTPELFAILAKMHSEDPSRCIVANDGFTMRAHQAWYEPYGDKPHTSTLPEEPQPADLTINSAGGWWDDHQAANSDVWVDPHWQGPNSYQWRSKNKGEIVQWGEMEGSAILDNHSLILTQIASHGGKSYDLLDHKEIDDAYNNFLTQWGFRKAFPSTSSLYNALGKRCYDTWRQYMENARICDENDYLSISGWESTAIENHSGIVDVFRNFKSDPLLISESLLPVHPVAKQHAMVYAMGEKATFDLFLLNDSTKSVSGTLVFTMTAPSGKKIEIEKLPAPECVKDQFSYPVKMGVDTPLLEEEGEYLFTFVVNGSAQMTHKRQIWVVKTDLQLAKETKVGLIGGSHKATHLLSKIGNLTVEPFAPGTDYDLLVASPDVVKDDKRVKFDAETGYKTPNASDAAFTLPPEAIEMVKVGKPLFLHAETDFVATGAVKDLSAAGAFTYIGMVGLSRAPWMGAWYFNREHPVYAGMPVNQALGVYYQVKGNPSNGWLVSGTGVEVITGYSRDHDRNIGAGTFVAKLGKGTILMHRVPAMQKVLEQRFYNNAVNWLLSPS
jgi:beta-galactosidase